MQHDVEAGTLNRVMLSDGAVVTVKGARSVSLRDPLDLPLPLNRSHKGRPLASGLLTLARALRQTARSNQKPLLSLRIVGPTFLTSAPSPAPDDKLKLKLKRLAPGLVELSSRTAPETLTLDDDVELSHASTLWPLTALNGSNPNLRGFEELLSSVLGKKGDEEGSFRLVKAQVSAQTYVKMGFAVEQELLDGQADWSGLPEWKTKPKKGKAHFEVLARVEEGGKVIPEKIAVVRPYVSQEVLADNVQVGNVSVSTTEVLHPPPIYFTL